MSSVTGSSINSFEKIQNNYNSIKQRVDTVVRVHKVFFKALSLIILLLSFGFVAAACYICAVSTLAISVLLMREIIQSSKETKVIKKQISWKKVLTKQKTAKTIQSGYARVEVANAYKALPRSRVQERAITIISNNIALNDICKIRAQEQVLRAQGRIIHGIHPLKQLGFVYSKKALRKNMKILYSYCLPFPTFIVKQVCLREFANSLLEWHENGLVVKYLTGFVNEIYQDDDVAQVVKDNLYHKLLKASQEEKFKDFLQILVDNF